MNKQELKELFLDLNNKSQNLDDIIDGLFEEIEPKKMLQYQDILTSL